MQEAVLTLQREDTHLSTSVEGSTQESAEVASSCAPVTDAAASPAAAPLSAPGSSFPEPQRFTDLTLAGFT